MTLVLAFAAASLFGIGTYLVLQRTLSRIIIGLALITHGANVLLITAGRGGLPPIVNSTSPDKMADPLPQALALTAIVITFAVTMLLLALAYRSWELTRDDDVEDDVGDRAIARATEPTPEITDQAEALLPEITTEHDAIDITP